MSKLFSDDNDLNSQIMRVMLIVAIILAIITLVWFVKNTFNLWSEQKNQAAVYQTVMSNKRTTKVDQTKQALEAQHLFGIVDSTVSNKSTGPEKLVGIILIPNANRAIFASDDVEEKIYKVGDKLVDGSVIYRIASGKVTLIRESVTKVLQLDWDENPENAGFKVMDPLRSLQNASEFLRSQRRVPK